MEEYGTFKICRMLGIKYERLRSWIDRRYVTCQQRPRGLNKRAVFGFLDMVRLLVFKDLVEMGISRERARELVNKIEEHTSEIHVQASRYCRAKLSLEQVRSDVKRLGAKWR